MKFLDFQSLISTCFSLSCVLFVSLTARADYIHQTLAEYSGTIMEFRIEKKQIKVILEIDEKDKSAFSDLLSAQKNTFKKIPILQTKQSQPLRGKITTRETRKRTPRGNVNALPTTDIMGRKLNLPKVSPYVTYVEIIYPLTQNTSQLILSPPLEKNRNYAAVRIGFITFHDKIPITNYWYLSQPEILNLNWEDPWYSRFENPNLTRPHPSSLLSYVYVEPYEVRHEILIRIRDLADFIKFEPTDIKSLQPQALEKIRAKAINYFQRQPQMTIDGQAVTPIIDKVNFLEADRKGVFQVIQNPQELDINSAIIGIHLDYPRETFPTEVKVDWNMFNEKIKTIPTVTTDPAGPFPYNLTPEDSVLVWKNTLTNYVIPKVEYLPVSNYLIIPIGLLFFGSLSVGSLVVILLKKKASIKTIKHYYYAIPLLCLLIGILSHPFSQIKLGKPKFILSQVSEKEAEVIFSHLLKNIYRAFDFREESVIYDKLAVSLDGDLLTDIYLQTRKSMEIENQGGAVATVENVEITDVKKAVSPSQGKVAFRTKWIASGILEHWGHRHNRQNQYDAILTIYPVNDVWKITDIELLEETRIK